MKLVIKIVILKSTNFIAAKINPFADLILAGLPPRLRDLKKQKYETLETFLIKYYEFKT